MVLTKTADVSSLAALRLLVPPGQRIGEDDPAGGAGGPAAGSQGSPCSKCGRSCQTMAPITSDVVDQAGLTLMDGLWNMVLDLQPGLGGVLMEPEPEA